MDRRILRRLIGATVLFATLAGTGIAPAAAAGAADTLDELATVPALVLKRVDVICLADCCGSSSLAGLPPALASAAAPRADAAQSPDPTRAGRL